MGISEAEVLYRDARLHIDRCMTSSRTERLHATQYHHRCSCRTANNNSQLKLTVCGDIKEGVRKLTQAATKLDVAVSLSKSYGFKEGRSVAEFLRHIQTMLERYEYVHTPAWERSSPHGVSDTPSSDSSSDPGATANSRQPRTTGSRTVTRSDLSDLYDDASDLSAQSDFA